MVRIRRSSTSPNSSICSPLQPSADKRNRSVTRLKVSRCFSAEPAWMAASTSSAIDRSSIARPERFKANSGRPAIIWEIAECSVKPGRLKPPALGRAARMPPCVAGPVVRGGGILSDTPRKRALFEKVRPCWTDGTRRRRTCSGKLRRRGSTPWARRCRPGPGARCPTCSWPTATGATCSESPGSLRPSAAERRWSKRCLSVPRKPAPPDSGSTPRR